ncbi:hypothetical protein [Saccharospirillum impatiens]|uniref:hypothetical protein n=1 Tax=Saccharospirillum impatiens TaxID=169438 RepID=UPI0004139562|nr:hypothetical protein [Saccharospirillum impatiens]
MNPETVIKQTPDTRRVNSLSTRLSANGWFQFLLIALLLVSWGLTGAHNALMATPPTDSLTGVNATDIAAHHAAMALHHNGVASAPGDPSLPHVHDLCADHCLSVMLPANSLTMHSREVTLTPEIQPAHWQPWRADLTPPPPKPGMFATLS